MKFYLLLICLLGSIGLSAQVAIDKDNHGAGPGVTERGKILKTGSVYLPDTGANKVYDYRAGILAGDSIMPRAYLSNNDMVNFPNATRFYIQSLIYSGLNFSASFYESNTSAAHSLIGYSMPRQGIDISSVSGTKGDSVIFIKQAHLFKTPSTILAYPATYKSNWQYTNRLVTDFLLNLHYQFVINYNNTPCQRVQNIIHKDSVVGWGKMRVPFDTSGSAAYDVIMVKYWEKVNDSAYINGQPASDLILAQLGTYNGRDTFTYGYKFYRPYFSTPLMTMETNAGYSKITNAYYDPDNIGITGIESNSLKISAVKVYPNPSANGKFMLEFDKFSNEKYTVSVMNIMGQKMSDQFISGTGNQQVNISLPENFAKGVYLYIVADANGKFISQGKLMK